MYSQKDDRWRDKKLGNSGLSMNWWGCVVTAIAEALTLAGYQIDPGQVCDKLNEIGGFTDDGRVIWAKVEEAFPQFHFGGDGYTFQKGVLGKHVHWLLAHEGHIYDPLTGSEGTPKGFVVVGGARTAAIDPAPALAEQPAPEAPAGGGPRTYVVREGDSLSKIAQRELGNGNRWPEIAELNRDIVADPNLIYPGQVLKLPN